MDLNKMVMDTMKKFNDEKVVEQMVEERLKETLNSIVKDAFRSYGDFGSALKEKVGAAIDINLEKLDIPSYNVMLANLIKEQIDFQLTEVGLKKMSEQLEDILQGSVEPQKLSDLIHMMFTEFIEEESIDVDYEDSFEVSVHTSGNSLTFIYMDPEEDKSNYECKYRIVLDKGIVSSISIDGKEVDNKQIMGGLYGLERLLFRMYCSGSELIIDNYATEFYGSEFYQE